MATSPITSTAARDLAFAAKNEALKSFTPKSKVNEVQANNTKIEANKATEVKAAREVQETKQAAKPTEEVKQAAVVNTRGEVTGTRINTSA